jgi:hypothetical protein
MKVIWENEKYNIEKHQYYFSKCREFLIKLYVEMLKNDPKFHFFYEPKIIIRIFDQKVLENVKKHLNDKH